MTDNKHIVGRIYEESINTGRASQATTAAVILAGVESRILVGVTARIISQPPAVLPPPKKTTAE